MPGQTQQDREGRETAAAAAAAAAAAQHPLPFRLLPVQPSEWDPASAAVTLNVRLDGCIVPSEAAPEGARISYSHLVVIDDFISDDIRQQLLDFLTVPGHAVGSSGTSGPRLSNSSSADVVSGQAAAAAADAVCAGTSVEAAAVQAGPHGGFHLPADRWERATADMAGGAATWGVRQAVLAHLAEGRLPALREVYARLCRLYPECDIAHLPSDAIQQRGQACQEAAAEEQQGQSDAAQQQQPRQQAHEEQQEEGQESKGPAAKRQRQAAANQGQAAKGEVSSRESEAGVDCNAFVANAAVEGDSFAFHVDADPTSFPDGSAWVDAYGDYCNGEPGKPLLASLMLYLNPAWQRDWGAETLFLDSQSDTGVHVRPRACRAVLFDQDLLHRVSPPSAAAGGRPRFSLVWKLAFLPRRPGQALCLARPEWGPPASVGSAARVGAVMRQLAAERRQGQQ